MSNPMNSTARKIHNLLSSGAVTVTGPSQPRNMKARINAAGTSGSNATTISTSNVNSRCYICDDILSTGTSKSLMVELETSHTNTRFPKKISQLAGPGIKVVVGPSDIVCSRCTNLINYLDRLENDVERVRTNLLNLMNKKYNLFTDVETAKINAKSGNATISNTNNNTNSSNVSTSDHGHVSAPPIKMQKLNTGSGVARVPQTMSAAVHDDASGVGTSVNEPTRKTAQNTLNTAAASTPAKSPVSAVQQLRINTPSSTTLQQSSSGTTSPTSSPQSNSGSSPINTPQRKSTKIYKCLMCDYRTSDMRLFNTHFESCKNQNFQCKNCRKIFPNFGSLKGHMVRDHNTSMDNTCAVCHVNFVSDLTLRKHMETTHATNVVVTSTSTLLPTTGGSSVTAHVPASPTHEAATTALHDGGKANVTTTTGGSVATSTANNNNNNNVANRLKPFKCRICAQRFETRDAATTHAKLHQPNFFKCGVCSLSFSKREMLVKHFAEHDHNQQQQLHQLQQQQQSQKSSINSNNAQQQQQQQRNIKLQQQQQQQQQQMQEDQQQLTTQKLLQDTIDEALSISGSSQQQQQLHNNATTITSTGIGSTMITTTTTSSNMSNNDTTGDSGDEQSSGGGNNNNNIRFFSCQVCSLTFIQKNYYTQHMETHRREGMIDAAGTNNNANNNKKTVATGNGVTVTAIGQNKNINVSNNNQQQQHQQQTPRRGGGVGSLNAAAVALLSDDVQEPRIATSKLAQRSKLGQGNRVSIGGTAGGISDADIESIFEKMHSEKNENSVGGTRNATLSPAPSSSSSASSAAGKIKITKKNASIPNKGPVVISTHGGASSGGISFNISIPGTETTSVGNSQRKSLAATTNSISIDMPALDTPDDGMKVNDINGGDSSGTNSSVGGGGGVGHLSSVSMPSLDDDGSDAAHATPSSSSNIGHHHHHQQQQKQMSGDTSVGFGTHKLDELAAAAEDSSAAQQAAAQLAESGIHHVAAAAVAAAAADEAAAAAAEAAEHKLLDISMDEQELEQQQHQQMDMTDAEQQQMHEQQQLQDQLDHDQQQQQLEHEQQQQQQQLEQQLEHEQQQLDDDEHQQHNVDGTNGAEGGTEMDLEEAMQAQVDSGQIKFILNENGQLLQLDNHIITDADGNQILVQDPEQIQQLLQSVGVLQSGDGLDGETIQMMTDANGQMVLVQGGEHNETQLIDASLLNSDGQLVIQQGQDGELGEGAHVIGEDGTRIPVSVSYTADGQPIVQVHNQMLQASDVDVDDQQHQQQLHHQHHHVLQQAGKDGVSELSVGDVDMHDEDDEGVNSGNGDGGGGLTTTSGAFLALEELMQQQHTGIDAKHSNE